MLFFLFKDNALGSVRLASKYRPQIRQRELSLLGKIDAAAACLFYVMVSPVTVFREHCCQITLLG